MTEFFDKIIANPELIATLAGFVGVIFTVLGAFSIAYYARKSPREALKLEHLKLMNQFVAERAFNKDSYNLVIEETFRNYFKTFIPIELIKIISLSKSRYRAFEAYKKVGKTVNWDYETKKLSVYSEAGSWVKAVASLLVSFVFLIISVYLLVLTVFFINDQTISNSIIRITTASVFGILSGMSFFGFLAILKMAIEYPFDLAKFKTQMKVHLGSPKSIVAEVKIIIGALISLIVLVGVGYLPI